MCPACAATSSLLVGSVVSTGGLTALLAKVLHKKKSEKSESRNVEKER